MEITKSNIEKREITKELSESYLDYAMSVIISRALPDVRDGLKPVQRRILWAMWESGLKASVKYRKSAAVIGEVLKSYHPHGDIAVYDALARMAQDFSLRYPLIDGQGNWGSIDGDNQAAMRYCVVGNTLIVTDKGLMPIEEISEDKSEDINIKVLSKDKSINKASKWFDSGEHPTIKITTKNGYSIQGSYNHPIIVWIKDETTGKPKFQWKLLNQITAQDIIVIDRTSDVLWPTEKIDLIKYWPVNKKTRKEIKKLPKTLDKNLAHILGALIAEGTIKENEIEFCNSDKNWIDDFKKRWQEVFPDCRLHHFIRKPNSFGKKPYETLEIHSRYVVEFLRNIGLKPVKSAQKNIPFLILQSPKSVAAEFLKSYFEGDGSISYSGKMTELSAISISESLIVQLQTLLLRFGVSSAKRFDNYRKNHKLYIRGLKNYSAFKKQIGFFSDYKNKKLELAVKRLSKDYSQTDFVPFLSNFVRFQEFNFIGNNLRKDYVGTHNFDRYSNMQKNVGNIISVLAPAAKIELSQLFEQLLLNNYLFDQVAEIKDAGIQKVYSLRVDSNCHSFVANGFINHNTECRLSKISEELLFDIEKETVDWQANYDGATQEPKVLPAKLPNLLLNGASGIAVGMATSIPPHNLSEIVDAVLHLTENPKATTEDLLNFVKGPDFPTGGIIYDKKAVLEAYSTGRGSITTRALCEIQERKSGQFNIVITEIPYQVNKSELIIKIANLAQEKKIEGIRDLRDESDREGMRIVIELKSDANSQKILNQLYKHTDLQKNFNLNMIALTTGGLQPQLLSLKEILELYIEHRKEVVRRRAEFDLRKAKERAHILEGLAKALSVIDKIIETIKKSKDREEAHKNLVSKFKFTDIQTAAILDMRLATLAALEKEKIENELEEKRKLIKELEALLASSQKILKVIKDELSAIKEKYGDERRTKVVAGGLKEFKEEDLIPSEDAVIILTADGYIKRLPPTTFKAQRRGGKGLIGSEVNEEDVLAHFISSNTHDNILFFTDKGKVFQTKVYEIPVGSRTAKGKLMQNFLEIPNDENISAIVSYGKENKGQNFLVMATKNGIIKKTSLEDFANIRRNGLIAVNLKDNDLLKWAKISSGKDEIIITTAAGQAIRFKESQLRPMGRTASGVKAIRLKKGDVVAGVDIIPTDNKEQLAKFKLLVVMESGFSKQTPLKEYKAQSRGGSGIKTAKIAPKTGKIVAAQIISDEEELLALSTKGQIIRTKISDIRVAGRATSGVKIMSLYEGDKVAGIVVL